MYHIRLYGCLRLYRRIVLASTNENSSKKEGRCLNVLRNVRLLNMPLFLFHVVACLISCPRLPFTASLFVVQLYVLTAVLAVVEPTPWHSCTWLHSVRVCVSVLFFGSVCHLADIYFTFACIPSFLYKCMAEPWVSPSTSKSEHSHTHPPLSPKA